ncbi:hypothetical protein JCM8547_008161 [Rhodosporidiobolus lusitaniae]
MASGFSYTGGRSRCFPFWQDFQKCYAGADVPEQCALQKEDYLECLHHTKEVSRAMKIKGQYLSSTAVELEQKRKEAVQQSESGGILGLGLINQQAAAAKADA